MRRTSKVGVILFLALAAVASAQFGRGGGAGPRGAQQQQQDQTPSLPRPAAEETPVFRSVTRLVQVDVVVRGKDAPVEGLTKADFALKDNGKPQNIAVFAVRKAEKPAPVQKLPANVASNRPVQAGPEPVSATILFLDRLVTEPPQQEIAREQAIKFLKQAHLHDPVAIYSLNSDLKVIQPFTDDRELLLHSLEASKSEIPYIAKDTPGAGRRIAEVTTAAFQELMRQMKGLPGRKKLIWMTVGIPLIVGSDGSLNGPDDQKASILTVDGAGRLLNDANVAFYPVSIQGVVRRPPPGGGTPGDVAELSGGRAFYSDNALDIGLQEAVDDTDTIYTLGFYQPSDAVDGQYHKISVDVLRIRPEAKQIKEVRYRRGYDAEQQRISPLTDKQRTGTLNALVRESLDATAIGIMAAGVPSKVKPGYYEVEVAVDVSGLQLQQKNGRRVGSFDLSVVPDIKEPKGLHQVVAVNLKEENYATALAEGITVINRVKVVDNKGNLLSKTLHFVVMDRTTGKAGSVRIPLNPPPPAPAK